MEPTLDIHVGQQVTAIDIDVVIATASGDTFIADSVIVTVPLGVLKDGTIRFSPPLPKEKTRSIEDLGKISHSSVSE